MWLLLNSLQKCHLRKRFCGPLDRQASTWDFHRHQQTSTPAPRRVSGHNVTKISVRSSRRRGPITSAAELLQKASTTSFQLMVSSGTYGFPGVSRRYNELDKAGELNRNSVGHRTLGCPPPGTSALPTMGGHQRGGRGDRVPGAASKQRWIIRLAVRIIQSLPQSPGPDNSRRWRQRPRPGPRFGASGELPRPNIAAATSGKAQGIRAEYRSWQTREMQLLHHWWTRGGGHHLQARFCGINSSLACPIGKSKENIGVVFVRK